MPANHTALPRRSASRLAAGALGAVLSGALGLAGCGGGGGPTGPGPGGMIPGGGNLTWLDDGTRHSASFATAGLARSSLMDYLQVAAADDSGTGLSFGVAVVPPVAGGRVECGGPNGSGQRPFASFAYNPGVAPSYISCSVTISTITLSGSPHVTGTFEAVFAKTGGGNKMLSDGKFDLPMTVSSL